MLDPRRREQSPAASRRSRSGGFIQTLEFLLLLSIFGVVILFGVRLFNEWLLNKINAVSGNSVYVYDATPAGAQLIGKAIALDTEQSPLVVLNFAHLPATIPPTFTKALIGMKNVRDFTAGVDTGSNYTFFTTHQALFFNNSTCTYAPDEGLGRISILNPLIDEAARHDLERWVPTVPDPDFYFPFLNFRQPYHRTSDFYTLQGWVYAIGPGNRLFRARLNDPAYAYTAGVDARSAWVSANGIPQCVAIPPPQSNPALPEPNNGFAGPRLRPLQSELLRAEFVDDLDAVGPNLVTSSDYNFSPGTAPWVGFWTPTRAEGTIPVTMTDPASESGPLNPNLTFTPATDEITPP